jgi:hypothetical protein
MSAFSEVRHVVCVEVGERGTDALIELCFADEMPEAHGGDGKTIRHLHSLAGEFAHHLAKRGVFAADERNVINRDVGEPFDERMGLG